MLKKYLKYGTITLACAGILGIIIGFSTSWKEFPIISLSGSSAVSPLITRYSNIYDKSDVVVQAGGSGVGINDALFGKKNIGMASKDPKGLIDQSLKQDWKTNHMKTITIAWDAIGIIYKPFSNNEKLDINDNNILNIYKLFAGNQKVSFNNLMQNGNNKQLTPFARDGGAEKSGTAEAFYQNSGLVIDMTKLDPKDKKALETGEYGAFTIRTSESNVESWEYLKSKNLPGSITYLSAGFIFNNRKEIEDNGFKVATYKGNELKLESISPPLLPIKVCSSEIPESNSNVGDQNNACYNWCRPFNLIISLNKINDDIKSFINWVIDTKNTTRNDILNKTGFVSLNENQNKSMEKNGNFWVPDFDLGYCGAQNKENPNTREYYA